jgi:transcriptional regulator with XRE-family HTH domain
MGPGRKKEQTTPLRAARERAGWTLEHLASESGVSRQTLWKAERNARALSTEVALAVAAAMKIDHKTLRSTMPLPGIDVSNAIPWARAVAKKYPPELDARKRLEKMLDAHKRIAASTGTLGLAADPEKPQEGGKVLALALGAERKLLASGAWLATTDAGRKFILCELADVLGVLTELEWRVGNENVELEVYARPPELYQ